MGWDLMGTEPGSKVQSWSCPSNLSPTRNPPSCDVSLKPLLAQALLVSPWGSTSLPHQTLSTGCLPHLCSPTGGWVLCLSTRTPLLAPAGTLPTAKSKEELSLHFPCSYTFSLVLLPDCQSGSGQQCSSSSVSFNKCVWKRLLAAKVWRPITQHACHEHMSGVWMKPMAPTVRLQHGDFQLPIKSSWWINVASRHHPLHPDQ